MGAKSVFLDPIASVSTQLFTNLLNLSRAYSANECFETQYFVKVVLLVGVTEVSLDML